MAPPSLFLSDQKFFEKYSDILNDNNQTALQLGQNIWKTISRRCTFGSKSGTKSLVRRYQAKFTKNCSRAFDGIAKDAGPAAAVKNNQTEIAGVFQ